MDNQILFPYNYEAYVHKGMAAWQQGNATLAAEYFQKALSIRKNEDVLLFYLMAVPETGMGRDALEFLKQAAPELWQSRALQDVDRFFIELLLQVGELEEAQHQIEQRHHLNDQAQGDLLLQLEDRLRQRQDGQAEATRQLYQQLLKEREQADKGGFLAMNAFLLQCKALPDTEYASLCIPLLEEGQIHPLHKTDILEELLTRHTTKEVLVTKAGSHKRVVPASLHPVQESPFYREGLLLLQEKGEGDEETRKGLEQNLFLHVAYYYPLEKEMLLSAEHWMDAVLALQQDRRDDQVKPGPVWERICEAELAMNELAGL